MTEESNNNNNDKKKESEQNEQEFNKEQVREHIEVEKAGKPVILRAEAYKTIILYASRYANQAIPSSDWKEIYGILIGYSDDQFVYIEHAEALTFGHDTDVQLDERHYGFIDEIQQKLDSDEEKKEYYMIGWFHSHPGLNLFFSYVDLINQLGFQQSNDDFVGLVFDHTLLGKKKKEKIDNNILTKYDTGFEIYRLTDITIDSNSVEFENNYHKVDYIVKGLNKFFFANVLTELSSLAFAGKPLQKAYKEKSKLESGYKDIDEVFDNPNNDPYKKNLVDIPLSEDVQFNVNNIYYDTSMSSTIAKESAEKLIYEGNRAFENKDMFTGIEKYRKGIEKYKEINDANRLLDLLRKVSRVCIKNNHLVLAREFAEELYKLAEINNQTFYHGIANYIIGYILLKERDLDVLELGLKKIEDAAIEFIEVKDFAGAGMAFDKIGSLYEKKIKNIGSACLFYREAIENYNNGLIYSHPLRITPWSKPEVLVDKIIGLRDVIEVLLPDIEDLDTKQKIINDLKSIQYNF